VTGSHNGIVLTIYYSRDANFTTRGPNPAPERVISGPRSRLRNIRNFSWMTEILWMILNFI